MTGSFATAALGIALEIDPSSRLRRL